MVYLYIQIWWSKAHVLSSYYIHWTKWGAAVQNGCEWWNFVCLICANTICNFVHTIFVFGRCALSSSRRITHTWSMVVVVYANAMCDEWSVTPFISLDEWMYAVVYLMGRRQMDVDNFRMYDVRGILLGVCVCVYHMKSYSYVLLLSLSYNCNGLARS